MKRWMLIVVGAVAVLFAQDAVVDTDVAQQTIVIPAHTKRPEVRYAPSRDVRAGDSVQVIVRFKAAGGSWTVPFSKQYSPKANSIPNDKVLLFVLKAAIEESPKVE